MTDKNMADVIDAVAKAATPRRVPLRQTETYRRALTDHLRTGREYHYRTALLGGKQLRSVACQQPSFVLGPELDAAAVAYADAWVEWRRADDALAALQKIYDHRNPCVDEFDEIIPEPRGWE